MRNFETKYGFFSEDGKEFVIVTPYTPRPWINVISNGDYGLVVSQNGSGYSWRTHAGMNRLTRWEQDLVRDEWGKYIYVRDSQSGKFWSAGWKPVCMEPESYRCKHGIGYTQIDSVNEKIESSLLIFVPNGEPLEVWKLTLRNLDSVPRKLSLFTYLEWGLGVAPDWHREFHKCFIETEFNRDLNAIFATKRLWEVPTENGHWNTNWPYVAFHSASESVSGFEGDKESFLGMYNGDRKPISVIKGQLNGCSGKGFDPIGSLQVNVELVPDEEKTICFTLGAADRRTGAASLAEKYKSIDNVDRAFDDVKKGWENILSTVQVETPDPALDLMTNTWLKYQSISGRLWGRTAYYQTGGAFGFRDQLQDSQVFLPIDPEQTRKQILLHARHQFKDGTVHHWWHPLTEDGLKTNMTDDLLWLPFLVSGYVQETGDRSILKDKASFVDDGKSATIIEHCNLAIDRVLKRMSKRGLPLIGAGDWNDGLSAVGLNWKGESVWLGEFLFKVLNEYSTCISKLDKSRSSKYLKSAASVRKSLNKHGWDGKWFWSATKDSGEKLGSKSNKDGKIHLNAQTWGVISGAADRKRAEAAMDSVETILEKKNGPLLLFPAYKTPDEKIGYLTRYSPGMRENGGVYTHAATWAVIAETMIGRAEQAYRMYSKINPVNLGVKPDEYVAEPYVTPGNIDGPESQSYGRGGWTWYTGSAAWLFKAGLDYILGIRASFDGLIIDPCIPAKWNGYKITRNFRGSELKIEIANPDHVTSGIGQISIDGKTSAEVVYLDRGVLVPPFTDGKLHRLKIVMGHQQMKRRKK